MEPLNRIFEEDAAHEVDELSSETPIGWSSICLDQTICYYIECNAMNSNDYDTIKSTTKNLL